MPNRKSPGTQGLFTSLKDAYLSGTWLTIGVFDGVHLGHQAIIQQLTEGARLAGAPSALITFNPHPASVLAGRHVPCISTPQEKAEILFRLGLDAVIQMEFTRDLAEQTPEQFMAEACNHLGVKNLLIGHDFALGKNRAGNFERLQLIGRELGYTVEEISPVHVADHLVSSSFIRHLIAEGDVTRAALKLGAPYQMNGAVVPGDGRGRTIGIPTANVNVPTQKVLPKNGVYACRAIVDDLSHPAVVNIGLRPTFTQGEVAPRVEAHLLDHHSDLYGKQLTLQFINRLRDEQKFPSIDALITQIRQDILKAREILE